MSLKSSAVSLYLLEPNICEYFLAVESSWICDYIQSFDADGFQEEKIDEKDASTQETSESSDKEMREPEQTEEKSKENEKTNEKLANPVKEEQP
jgi:hypothetical protein